MLTHTPAPATMATVADNEFINNASDSSWSVPIHSIFGVTPALLWPIVEHALYQLPVPASAANRQFPDCLSFSDFF